MEEIKQLVYNYAKAVHSQNEAKAVHSQNEEEFKALWSSKENILISLANQFNGTDAIYQDFLIGGIQSHYESIDLVVEKIDIRMIDENKAIVVFRYHTECIRRDTHEPYGIQGLETQIVIKENNQWKLMHIHYSKK